MLLKKVWWFEGMVGLLHMGLDGWSLGTVSISATTTLDIWMNHNHSSTHINLMVYEQWSVICHVPVKASTIAWCPKPKMTIVLEWGTFNNLDFYRFMNSMNRHAYVCMLISWNSLFRFKCCFDLIYYRNKTCTHIWLLSNLTNKVMYCSFKQLRSRV